MLELGSCGLHFVHGAYHAGQNWTNWRHGKSLKAFHTFFKKSPARQSEYLRSNDLADNHGIRKTEYKSPWDTKAFQTVKEALGNPMFLMLLEFSRSLAMKMQPFLSVFKHTVHSVSSCMEN